MPSNDSKQLVRERILAFARRYVTPQFATYVTLGEDGSEGKLWQAEGVRPHHGWLIERNPARSRALVASETPYRHVDRLNSIPAVLAAVEGSRAAIDLLDADLCGTIEVNFPDIAPLMPLVARSRGRCLAITVADARRNRFLDATSQWPAGCEFPFGAYAQNVMNELVQQNALIPRNPGLPLFMRKPDPRKGGLRELSMLMSVTKLGIAVGLVPHDIERIVYVSRWSGRSFRMRTYLVHFANAENDRIAAARAAAAARTASPLFFLSSRKGITTPPGGATKEALPMFDALRRLAEAAGGPAEAEFKEMLTVVARAQEIEAGLQALTNRTSAAVKTPDAGASTAAAAASAVTTRKARRKRATRTVNGASVEVQLALIEAAAKGDRALKGARIKAIKALGIGRKRNKLRTIGALYARTQGGFRGDFVARALTGLSEAERAARLKQLAGIYSALTGKRVTAADLATEAGVGS